MIDAPSNQVLENNRNTLIDTLKVSVVDIDVPPVRQDWNTSIGNALLALSEKSDISTPEISSNNMSPKK